MVGMPGGGKCTTRAKITSSRKSREREKERERKGGGREKNMNMDMEQNRQSILADGVIDT